MVTSLRNIENNTVKLLFENWREYLNEIAIHPSLTADQFGDATGVKKKQTSADFVKWAKHGADEKTQERISHDGLELQVADMGDHTRIIAYVDDEPAGYVAVGPVKNMEGIPIPGVEGMMVETVAVAEEHRGTNIAKKLYAYLIEKYNLFSGASQTPESRGLWNNYLKKNYNVKAVDATTGQLVFDIPDLVYTEEGDEHNNIYLFIPRGGK